MHCSLSRLAAFPAARHGETLAVRRQIQIQVPREEKLLVGPQRQIFYYDGAYNATYAYGLSYPPTINCPRAASMLGPYWDGVGDFGVYFFFGGPDGLCQ